LEFSEVPEGEGVGLDVEDVEEDETEDGEVEGVELGEATLFSIEEPEPGVVVGVGWVPGTGVGPGDVVEVVDGGLAALGLEDPPPLVMVKVGEMLSALPIKEMMYVFLSGYPEGTTMFTFPAVMGKPLARGVLSCRLYPSLPSPSIHPKTTIPMGFVIWVGKFEVSQVTVCV